MKKFLALFLALLCVFCFVGCNTSDDNENNTTGTLTDYEKIAQYVAQNDSYVTIEHNTYGTITISNPGDIIRIQCVTISSTISIQTILNLKENEDYFNYEGIYSYNSTFSIKGSINASIHDYDIALTYHTASGSGYTNPTSLRVINQNMINALYTARINILSATSVDIYELYGFDALI